MIKGFNQIHLAILPSLSIPIIDCPPLPGDPIVTLQHKGPVAPLPPPRGTTIHPSSPKAPVHQGFNHQPINSSSRSKQYPFVQPLRNQRLQARIVQSLPRARSSLKGSIADCQMTQRFIITPSIITKVLTLTQKSNIVQASIGPRPTSSLCASSKP